MKMTCVILFTFTISVPGFSHPCHVALRAMPIFMSLHQLHDTFLFGGDNRVFLPDFASCNFVSRSIAMGKTIENVQVRFPSFILLNRIRSCYLSIHILLGFCFLERKGVPQLPNFFPFLVCPMMNVI